MLAYFLFYFRPKLVSYMESVKDVVESRRGVINDSVKNVKELDDVIVSLIAF